MEKVDGKIWAWAKVLAVLLLIAVLLCCCRSVKVVPVETVRYDSVAVHDTMMELRLIPYRDSVVTEDDSSFLSNAYAYSAARVREGRLYHSLVIWPFATGHVAVPYFIEKYVRVSEPKIVPVERKLSAWERTKIRLPACVAGFVIGIVLSYIWRIKRRT